MSFDFKKYLVVAVSSRALFDLTIENDIFEKEGLEAYSRYQLDHEDEVLQPGVAFPLIKGILRLNELVPKERKTEVIVMSRNNADTSLRITKSIEAHGLDITRGAYTSGVPITDYLEAFDVDLFLSAHQADIQSAIDAGRAAARILAPPEQPEQVADQIRIAFDGDAVLFSEESELIYQEQGLEAFIEHERANARKTLAAGPFAKLLRVLSKIQQEFNGTESAPIRTALVTSRNSPAHERVIRTLREWNVRIDEAFFLGDASKDGVLQAFKPHIFFDDSDRHVQPASKLVPVAQVPHRTQLALPAETGPLVPHRAPSEPQPDKRKAS
jgi:5'-nucleotidase